MRSGNKNSRSTRASGILLVCADFYNINLDAVADLKIFARNLLIRRKKTLRMSQIDAVAEASVIVGPALILSCSSAMLELSLNLSGYNVMLKFAVFFKNSVPLFFADSLGDDVLCRHRGNSAEIHAVDGNLNLRADFCIRRNLLRILKRNLRRLVLDVLRILNNRLIRIDAELESIAVDVDMNVVNPAVLIPACAHQCILDCVKKHICADALFLLKSLNRCLQFVLVCHFPLSSL